jgi:LysR family transcriptional regulator, nod-box dependent transcriptional activator
MDSYVLESERARTRAPCGRPSLERGLDVRPTSLPDGGARGPWTSLGRPCDERLVLNLRQVDLNLLVALDALLKERSVTRAGRQMGLSQPAMSAALHRLRELFADPLLERVGREYRLTPFARDLQAPLQEVLASIERTLASNARFDPATTQRHFRIATSDYVLCVLLQPVIERVTRLAPGVRIHLQPIDAKLAGKLTSRRVDLSIQPPGLLQGFSSQALFRDDWVCAVWRGHEEVGERLTREQFYTLPHASFSLGQSSMVEHNLQTPEYTLHVPVTSVSFVALPFLLRGTRMVAVIQRRLAQKLEDVADMRILELPVALPEVEFSMWWSPAANDPAHAWLRDVLAEAAQALR